MGGPRHGEPLHSQCQPEVAMGGKQMKPILCGGAIRPMSQVVPLRFSGRQAGTWVSFKSNGEYLTTVPESLGYSEGKSPFVFHAVLTLRIAQGLGS